MKKLLALCTAAALMLTMTCCAAGKTEETTPVQTVSAETTVPAETIPETTIPETTEAKVEGLLLLTVSSITFTLQGESEDVYTGTLPRELITWGSADESVALFQDGILTAAGVGSTTVYAEYEDQRVECSVSCLAATEEEAAALSAEVLRTPKRMPAIVEEWPEDFYDDAAFVGDSITYTLWHTAGKNPDELGNTLFLVRGGTSINGFVKNYKNIYYQGKEMHLDDAVAASGVKKVFFMLGQNDLGYMIIEDTMANWDLLLERILALSPDVEIYIQSLVPEWLKDTSSNEKNEKIDEYNIRLKEYCDENGYYFVDIAPYIEDHANKMATVYSQDFGIHINYDGTAVWMQALKAYALLHTAKGE